MDSLKIPETEINNLREYLKIFKKWKFMIAALTTVIILTTAIISFVVLSPIYQASTVLMLTQIPDTKKTVLDKSDLESIVNTVSRLPEMTINTYVGQIKADIILKRVTERLKLNPQTYTLSMLTKMINVKAIKDSNLIEIDVENTDPQLAMNIANTLADEYLKYISEKNQQQMSRSVEFLLGQVVTEEKNMTEAIHKLESFQSQPRGVDMLKQEMATKTADLMKYQSSLQQLELEYQQKLAEKASQEGQLAATPNTINVNKRLAEDPALYGVVYDEKVKPTMLVSSSEPNPDHQKLSQDLSAKIIELSGEKAQLDGMVKVVADLQNYIKNLQKELTEKQTQLELLQSDVERFKTTFSLLQEKITQTQIAKSINLGETSLIITSPALIPEDPIKPKKALNLAVAAVLGLLISVLLAILLEKLDNTFKRFEDVENILGLPVLGNIPLQEHIERKLITFSDPKSPLAEAFRTFRTNLHFSALDKPYKTLLFTSTGPEEGKSTLLSNTAVAMAQTGSKVLIVDCDLRKPVQHKIFNLANIQGLTNILVDEIEPSSVIQPTGVLTIDLLSCGPIPPNPAELLASGRMEKFLQQISGKYDTILFDTPPLIAVTDATLLSAKVSGTFLVIRASRTTFELAKEAKEQLEKANAKIIGAVLNGIEYKGEDYEYYYYYGHRKGKTEKNSFLNFNLKWGK